MMCLSHFQCADGQLLASTSFRQSLSVGVLLIKSSFTNGSKSVKEISDHSLAITVHVLLS